MSWTNTLPGNANNGDTYTAAAATVRGDGLYIFPWVASARPALGNGGTVPGDAVDDSTRTATLCYMRGLKEKIQIQTNSGVPWQWRRICFCMKGRGLIETDGTGIRWSLLTSNGMVRVLNTISGTTAGTSLVDRLFDGTFSIDWINAFTAKTDNTAVDVKYDRTFQISSGNANGVMRNFNMWHGMNKNLMFSDEERGADQTLGRYSRESKIGMGDYYVIDIISAGTGGTGSDLLTFLPESTLYWHEK